MRPALQFQLKNWTNFSLLSYELLKINADNKNTSRCLLQQDPWLQPSVLMRAVNITSIKMAALGWLLRAVHRCSQPKMWWRLLYYQWGTDVPSVWAQGAAYCQVHNSLSRSWGLCINTLFQLSEHGYQQSAWRARKRTKGGADPLQA